ncbi:zinc carboxypeptidase [Verrucosispora sp. SN26_14.1]|nr:zinc carboxypeptidase [Verrucosispora sp. SN26_14.1]
MVSTTVATMCAVTLFAPSSSAENVNANCGNLPGNRSDSGWTDYEQLGKRLDQIEATSNGRVAVDVIGTSHRGRDIYTARVGTGDRVLLITSEIHGNEKTGTEALLQMLKTLGSSGSPQAKMIRDNLTIVAVPKFNPDGAELNRRQNDFPWTEVVEKFPQLAGTNAPYYYSNGARGFDVNRDFSADLTAEPSPATRPSNETLPGMYLTNESRALRDLYVNLRDEFGKVHAYVDLHHMGPCNENIGTDQYVTVALDFPPLGSEVDGNPRYADWPLLDQDASRRHTLAAALGMMQHAGNGSGTGSPFFGGVSQYVHYQVSDGYSFDRDYAGQARSAFALNGSASVLFEVRGQSHAWGQKQKGQLTKAVEAGIVGIAERMADRSVDSLNGDDFYELPKYW